MYMPFCKQFSYLFFFSSKGAIFSRTYVVIKYNSFVFLQNRVRVLYTHTHTLTFAHNLLCTISKMQLILFPYKMTTFFFSVSVTY